MELLKTLMNDARNGDAEAARKIGDMYREGANGTKYSPRSAYRWYAESALGGSAVGQNNVGLVRKRHQVRAELPKAAVVSARPDKASAWPWRTSASFT
jgi:TPR repeat protein